MNNLTVIYYTCNYLDHENPYFLENTKKQLVKAIGDLPLIVVSHEPVAKESFPGYAGEYKNIVVNLPREHLSIYRQILIGCKEAKTDYVAMAEDDILYSYEHFHSEEILKNLKPDLFLYDMMKVSIFTWTKPPMFSFRTKRKVVNQLLSGRQYLIDALEERFALNNPNISLWGDPGRYEAKLGVTVRNTYETNCDNPSIVFTHPKAYGYEFNHGKRKRLGDLKIIELYGWGKASEILKLHTKPEAEKCWECGALEGQDHQVGCEAIMK